MRNLITQNGTRIPTVAETIASAILTRASTGHIKAAECAMENIEGKLSLPVRHEGETPPMSPPIINVHVVGGKFKKPEA